MSMKVLMIMLVVLPFALSVSFKPQGRTKTRAFSGYQAESLARDVEPDERGNDEGDFEGGFNEDSGDFYNNEFDNDQDFDNDEFGNGDEFGDNDEFENSEFGNNDEFARGDHGFYDHRGFDDDRYYGGFGNEENRPFRDEEFGRDRFGAGRGIGRREGFGEHDRARQQELHPEEGAGLAQGGVENRGEGRDED